MQTAYSINPRARWDAYVARKGGVKAVSEALGIPYPTIACITNGSRGIGHRLANRMASRSNGELDAEWLVWVRPIRDPEVA
jgi:hypothetical protein